MSAYRSAQRAIRRTQASQPGQPGEVDEETELKQLEAAVAHNADQPEDDEEVPLSPEPVTAGSNSHPEVTGRPKRAPDYLNKKSPEQLFNEFDTDGSGLIDFKEFKAMLPALGISITEAKALKYFRFCDEDGSGEIDLNEFKVALFALDPVTGNTLGFAPSKLLTPSDAFEMYDTNRSGNIDEDEFFFALQYLGLDVSDGTQEYWFNKFDEDKSGSIDYNEFKKIWLHLANLKQELVSRGVEVTKWMTKSMMRKKLREIVEAEELAERKTLHLAKQWADWQRRQQERTEDLRAAATRAKVELATAMDIGGQVYMFGTGAYKQFQAKPVRPEFIGFDALVEAFKHRLGAGLPEEEDDLGSTDEDDDTEENDEVDGDDDNEHDEIDTDDDAGGTDNDDDNPPQLLSPSGKPRASQLHAARKPRFTQDSPQSRKGHQVSAVYSQPASNPTVHLTNMVAIKPGMMARRESVEAYRQVNVQPHTEADEPEEVDDFHIAQNNLSRFKGLTVAVNTVALWCRRITSVRFGQSTAFALSDQGQLFTWGGRYQWWNVPGTSLSIHQAATAKSGKTTERSQLQMGIPPPIVHPPKSLPPIIQGDGPVIDAARARDHLAVVAARGNSVGLHTSRSRGSVASDSSRSPQRLDEISEADAAHIVSVGLARQSNRRGSRASYRERVGSTASRVSAIEHAAALVQTGQVHPTMTNVQLTQPEHRRGSLAAGRRSSVKATARAMSLDDWQVDPYELGEEEEAALRQRLAELIQTKADAARADMLQTITQYYGVWEPAPIPAHRLRFMEAVLMPKITFDQLANSLRLRGKSVKNLNKEQLTKELFLCLEMEQENLTEDQRTHYREMERIIEGYELRGQRSKAQKLRAQMLDSWAPLLEKQLARAEAKAAEDMAARDEQEADMESSYAISKLSTVAALQESRLALSPRGKHPYLPVAGVTYRAPRMKTFRGGSALRDIGVGAFHCIGVHEDGRVFSWGSGSVGQLGLGCTEGNERGQGDSHLPTLVEGMRGMRAVQAYCGHNHSMIVTSTGHVFVWGACSSGKLGLGKLDGIYEPFCPRPVPLKFPPGTVIKSVACGPSHSAAVTTEGGLFMWGSNDSGKLGVKGVGNVVYTPMLNQDLLRAGVRVGKIACGDHHSVLITALEEQMEGSAEQAAGVVRTVRGGEIWVCGNSNSLGRYTPVWTWLESCVNMRCLDVAVGNAHSVVCTVDGEMYTWGSNVNGCLGFPPDTVRFVNKPTRVPSLYVLPKNLARNPHCVASQSSTFNNRQASIALSGDTSGTSDVVCSHTLLDPQPWWQLDLGQNAALEKLVLWNRNDVPVDPAKPRDMYSSRLFPCWVMLSQEPLPHDLPNAIRKCTFKRRLSDNQRRTVITLPQATVARYVRIQLERINYLHIAQVEAYGTYGSTVRVGRVTSVAATAGATVAVMAPAIDPQDVEQAYKRAVRADANNAVILRQLSTYYALHDQIGRGESLSEDCPLCTPELECEICYLERRWGVAALPPGPLGRRRRLASIHDEILSEQQPQLDWPDDAGSRRASQGVPGGGLLSIVSKFKAWRADKAAYAAAKRRASQLALSGAAAPPMDGQLSPLPESVGDRGSVAGMYQQKRNRRRSVKSVASVDSAVRGGRRASVKVLPPQLHAQPSERSLQIAAAAAAEAAAAASTTRSAAPETPTSTRSRVSQRQGASRRGLTSRTNGSAE